jgi:hypothetical protein
VKHVFSCRKHNKPIFACRRQNKRIFACRRHNKLIFACRRQQTYLRMPQAKQTYLRMPQTRQTCLRIPQNCLLQSSFTQRTAQFTQGILQFPRITCRHHDGIISRHSTELTKKTDKLDGKTVLCQRTFSSVIRAVFYAVKLRGLA